MNITRILILEDDLATLSYLLKALYELEERLLTTLDKQDISITIFSEYTQVEDYLNISSRINFDVILLDRDCKLGGSFYALDLTRFDANKIISISSIPEYNEEARKMGITKIVHKDYANLNSFAHKVTGEIEKILTNTRNPLS